MQWRCLLIGLFAAVPVVEAQLPPNLPYDGRAILARLRYHSTMDPDGCQDADGSGGPGWGHDYPASVQGLMKAATELTSLEAPVDSFVTLNADDTLLLKYPVAMVTEPGCWNPTDTEVVALRNYLLKGGFLVVDDPTFSDVTPEHCELAIQRFETWIHRVLPAAQIVRVPTSDPIFDGFFQVNPETLPPFWGSQPEIRGIYRDNDPTKSLMVIANYRYALGHQWRWVGNGLGSGLGSGDEATAYQLGLNYLVYGLSH